MFQLVPTILGVNLADSGGLGLRAGDRPKKWPIGASGPAIGRKSGRSGPPGGRSGEKCSNFVPTCSKSRYRRGQNPLFVKFIRVRRKKSRIGGQKRPISWCSKFQLFLPGEVTEVFVIVPILCRCNKLELGTFSVCHRNDVKMCCIPHIHAVQSASGARRP